MENQKTAIVFRVEGFPAEIAKIKRSADTQSVLLHTKWGQSDLNWLDDDGYAFIETSKGRILLVFSPNGGGFCIDVEGKEIPLEWHD